MNVMKKRPWMSAGRIVITSLLLCTLLSLAGCAQFFYLLAGRDKTEAEYKIDPKARVLVFTDSRPGLDIPMEVPDLLAERIVEHMYEYKAADNFVKTSRIMEMRKDPSFKDLSISDVGRMVEADVVIYVEILRFNVISSSEGLVNEGNAEAVVKIVDKDGKRLWPTDNDANPLGKSITADMEESMADMRPDDRVQLKLIDRLGIRIGRLFHTYSADDRNVAK